MTPQETAVQQGYEPDACSSCKRRTLVKNGDAYKCTTCGETGDYSSLTSESRAAEERRYLVNVAEEIDIALSSIDNAICGLTKSRADNRFSKITALAQCAQMLRNVHSTTVRATMDAARLEKEYEGATEVPLAGGATLLVKAGSNQTARFGLCNGESNPGPVNVHAETPTEMPVEAETSGAPFVRPARHPDDCECINCTIPF